MNAPVLALTTDERARLLAARRAADPMHGIDFAPHEGRCYSCRADLVDVYRERYVTAYITGCPKCCRSYCD